MAFAAFGGTFAPVTIEIINTGSELLLGRILNTHQQWLCSQLTQAGYTVARQVLVSDRGEDIQQAVREGLGRADLVITTGGLGPTCDDITRERIAELLGRTRVFDAAVSEAIQAFSNRVVGRFRRAPGWKPWSRKGRSWCPIVKARPPD